MAICENAPLCCDAGAFTPNGNCVEAIVELERNEIKCVKVKQVERDNALSSQEQTTQWVTSPNCKIANLSRARICARKIGSGMHWPLQRKLAIRSCLNSKTGSNTSVGKYQMNFTNGI